MRYVWIAVVTVLLTSVPGRQADAHCQVPCGIYDDEARFVMIEENLLTIEKAMGQITSPAQANQVVRWVTTKDQHANDIIEILAHYFLAQRIKAPETSDVDALHAYGDKLVSLHGMIVDAMKCKQTTDPSHVTSLRSRLAEFHDQYFGVAEEEQEHGHEHGAEGHD